jgi:hypothetical protein
MDYTPRAETIRQLAAAAYLPFVALVLLAQRRYREVRLVRFHSYQAIGIAIALLLTLLAGSLVSTLFGNLPGLGFLINMGVGLVILGGMVLAIALAFYGAVMAYQGNYTSVPILTEWVWLQVNGNGRKTEPPRKKRRRRVREEDEIDWDELPIPPQALEEETPEER